MSAFEQFFRTIHPGTFTGALVYFGFVAAVGLIVAPLFHRLLHRFHFDEE